MGKDWEPPPETRWVLCDVTGAAWVTTESSAHPPHPASAVEVHHYPSPWYDRNPPTVTLRVSQTVWFRRENRG